MAYEVGEFAVSGLAASNIQAGFPVALVGQVTAGSAADERYQQATIGKGLVGVARATALAGRAVDVQITGVVKVRAAASLAAGSFIGPISGGSSMSFVTGASNPVVGIALNNAAAGDLFPVLLVPGAFAL
jgi:hypothetical protein